jgi:UDP-glucose:(heptosyl)LPS alpha-1,3-glucosyltransferase
MRIALTILHARQHRASRYIGEVVPHFLDAGHEVHLLANRWDALDPRVIIHKLPAPTANFKLQELGFTAAATLAHLRDSFDVTMAQPTRYLTPNVGYLQFVYSSWIKWSGQTSFWSRAIVALERHNVKRARALIVMSDLIKREVQHFYGVPDERISIVRSGVDLQKFSPANRIRWREPIRRELGIGDEPLILMVGNPYHRKGLVAAVDALPRIPDARLLVVGREHAGSAGGLRQTYINQAAKLGVADRLLFHDITPDVERYMAAADIFLLPTLYEPFGLVVLEAMAAGLPAVVSGTDRCGATELITDGIDGLLLEDPENPQKIAEVAREALEPTAARHLGTAARTTAERYTWGSTARGMLKVFESRV